MSIDLEEGDVAGITVLLSAERLSALHELTGSPRAAIDLHQKTLKLGLGLMHIIACVELAVRNVVSENLNSHFGVPGWLIRPPHPFRWRDREAKLARQALDNARRAAYSKLTQAEKAALDQLAFPNGRPASLSHTDRAKARRAQITVSDGKVIAETTIYFWKRLYSPDYEHSLWSPTLKRTFPNKKIKRSDVATMLEYIYQARNRVAHHEPVLHKRLDDTINAIEFVAGNLGTTVPSYETPLGKLIIEDLDAIKHLSKVLHEELASFRS